MAAMTRRASPARRPKTPTATSRLRSPGPDDLSPVRSRRSRRSSSLTPTEETSLPSLRFRIACDGASQETGPSAAVVASALQAWQVRALFLVSAVVVCDYVGVSMMRIALPFYAKALRPGSSTFAGSLETMYGLGQVLGALTLPRLSDTWGRRAVLMTSCAGSALGYGLAIAARLTSSPTLLQISRVPVGLSKQTVTVSRAVVADCTRPDRQRSHWMALLGSALGVGCVVGPFVGGYTAEAIGEASPAIIATIIFICLGPLIFALLPETVQDQTKTAGEHTRRAQRGSLWLDARLLSVLGVLALGELGVIAHASVTLSGYCINALEKSPTWLGNLSSLSAILQALFSGITLPFLSSRRGWSDVSILQLGVLAFALASFLIAYGKSAESVMLSAPPAALANAVLRAYPATWLSKHVDEDRQGMAQKKSSLNAG